MSEPQSNTTPPWTPLSRQQRRVLGVLVEKAKTTPEQYPMSLNGLTTGCNQKSNRSPMMDLQPEQVEDALEFLRGAGAVGEVQGTGRVPKYRHYCKEWLGVEGTELAVMAELLLRGPQSVGDLRGRAARMAPGQLADVNSLRPVLLSLMEKNLVLALTPEGRGQVVSHNLFQPEELAKARAEHAGGAVPSNATAQSYVSPPQIPSPHVSTAIPRPATSAMPRSSTSSAAESPTTTTGTAVPSSAEVSELRAEVTELRSELARLRKEVEDLWQNLGGA